MFPVTSRMTSSSRFRAPSIVQNRIFSSPIPLFFFFHSLPHLCDTNPPAPDRIPGRRGGEKNTQWRLERLRMGFLARTRCQNGSKLE
jgi:hypothetical protein